MDNNKEKKPLPPYLSYKTFRNFIDSYAVTPIDRIDRSAMPSLSGANQSWLIGALRYFQLIKDDGRPTEDLPKFAKSQGQERKKLLRDILARSYPFVFESIKLESATPRQLEEQFEKTEATGDTVKKCIAFFLAAVKEADLTLSPLLRRMRYSRPRNRRQTATPGSPGVVPSLSDELEEQEPSWITVLMAKFPSFDPAWPDDVKAKWFDAFKQMMDTMKEKEKEKE